MRNVTVHSRWWLATLLAPAAWFLLVGTHFDGFTGQPGLVLAGDAEALASRLADVGGTSAARAGVLVDVGFMLLLAGSVGVSLAAAGGRWRWVLPALALDFTEGVALWVLAGDPSPSSAALGLLYALAVAKLLAYALAVVALVWAWRRRVRRP